MFNPEKAAGWPAEAERAESGETEVKDLDDFDMEYFREIEGDDGWIALDMENCRNQRYFTAKGIEGEPLGIVGVYDTDDERNISHTVVDPRFRGQGLSRQLKDRMMDRLGLPYVILTVDLDNAASLRAAEKLPGVKRVSDESYEREYHKAKFIYERPKPPADGREDHEEPEA